MALTIGAFFPQIWQSAGHFGNIIHWVISYPEGPSPLSPAFRLESASPQPSFGERGAQRSSHHPGEGGLFAWVPGSGSPSKLVVEKQSG